MSLTTHFIDDSSKLQKKKKILNYCVVPNYNKGETLGKVIKQCLFEWRIERIIIITALIIITMNNVASNNNAFQYVINTMNQ